jgi:hypothetical protein
MASAFGMIAERSAHFVEEFVKKWKKMENYYYLCPLRIRIE